MKHVLSNSITSTANQPYTKVTHEFYNAMISELATMFGESISYDSTASPIIIYGCVGTTAGGYYSQTAGALYYNGEVYMCDAMPSQVLSTAINGHITTTYDANDPLLFDDLSTHNVHQIKRIVFNQTAGGEFELTSTTPRLNNGWQSLILTAGTTIKANTGTITLDSTDANKEMKYFIDWKNKTCKINLCVQSATTSAASLSTFSLKLPLGLKCTKSFQGVGQFTNSYLTTTEAANTVKQTLCNVYTNTGATFSASGDAIAIVPHRSAFVNFDMDGSANINIYAQIEFQFD